MSTSESESASDKEPSFVVKSNSRMTGSRLHHAFALQDCLLQQMLSNSEICDVTLRMGEMSVKAHWCVLMTCPFFQSLYDSGMRESSSGEITLNFGSPLAMKEAICFLYQGLVQVTYDNVRDLIEVAEYLQISTMKQCCVEYLSTVRLNIENCVQLTLLSSLYNLELYNMAFEFVCGHLPEVMQLPDMLQLTKDSLLTILTDPTLLYVKREQFFDFIVRWTEHDKASRAEWFEELFLTLDLKLMTPTFLANSVENNLLVLASEKCKMSVVEAKVQGLEGLTPGCSATREIILVCGGTGAGGIFRHTLSGSAVSDVYAYIIKEDRWAKLPSLPIAIRKPMVALEDNGGLLVFDSSYISSSRNLLFRYSPHQDLWTSVNVSVLGLIMF